MAILRYAANVGRSVGYALPQIAKNKIPNVLALAHQISDKGQRENAAGALREISGILKENVFDLLKKGLDDTKSRLRSGKFVSEESEAAEDSSFAEAFGMDESLFSNDFLGGDPLSGETGSTPTDGGSQSTAAAAAYGAATGVQAIAESLGSSPAQNATAEATYATARYSRAQLGTSIAVGNMLRGSILANAQVLGEIHRFQSSVQHSFYKQSLEHHQSMQGMTSEIVATLRELREVSGGTLTASEQLARMISGTPSSDYSDVFDSDGGFSLGNYIGLLARRTKEKIGSGSQLKMMATMLLSSPVQRAVEMLGEQLIPQRLSDQLEQFNGFLGRLGGVLNERARRFGSSLRARGELGGIGASIIDFLTVAPERSAAGPDLSKFAKDKAVSFDGYAHRSIVEVIPSYLADIHAELVSMRQGQGHKHIGDRKTYDMETGRFTSENALRQAFEKSSERASLSHFGRAQALMGGTDEEALVNQRLFRTMRDANVSLPSSGKEEELRSLLADLAGKAERGGKAADASAIRSQTERFIEAHQKHGSRLLYEMQDAIIQANRTGVGKYADVIGKEGAQRWMFNNDGIDPDTGLPIRSDKFRDSPVVARSVAETRVAGRGKKRRGRQRVNITQPAPSTAALPPEEELYITATGRDGFNDGYADERSAFRDADGNVTARSILRSPAVLLSKAMRAFETKISDALFGSKDGKKGFLGSLISPIVDPLRKLLVGDASDPKSQEKSLFGRVKALSTQAFEKAGAFLFGKKAAGADGVERREGGLLGSVAEFMIGKGKKLKEFLLGQGDADGKGRGVLVRVRDKLETVAAGVGKYLFGEKYTTTDDAGNEITKRRGGLLGGIYQKGKDLVSRMYEGFQNKIVQPLAASIFGEMGTNGRRSGGLLGGAIQKGKDFVSRMYEGFQAKVVQPMTKYLFGENGKGGLLSGAIQKGKDFVSRIAESVRDSLVRPVSAALFAKGEVEWRDGKPVGRVGQGVFPKLFSTLKDSIYQPVMTELFGKRKFVPDGKGGFRLGRDGTGAVPKLWQAVKDAFAPLKETLMGANGLWPQLKKGLSDTFADLRVALFGKQEDGPQEPFMRRLGRKITTGIQRFGDWMVEKLKPVTDWIQKGGDWLRTKVFEPFGKWLNDPKTGFITRMREGTAKFFYGEKNTDGVREGGLFGAVKKGMDRFFYGDPEKGTKGFVERVVVPAKKFVLEEIWEPLKRNVGEMWEGAKGFVRKELLEPLKGTLRPFIEEAKQQWHLLKEWTKGPLWETLKGVGDSINQSLKNTFGTSLTEMLRKNVLDPIKEALGSVRKFLGTALGSVLKIPVNVFKNVSDELKMSQIRRGIGGYLAGSERSRLLEKFGVSEKDVPAGSGSSTAELPTEGGKSKESGVRNEEKKKGLLERIRDRFSSNPATVSPPDPVRAGDGVEHTAGAIAQSPSASPAASTPPTAVPSPVRAGSGVEHTTDAVRAQAAAAASSTGDQESAKPASTGVRSTSPEQAMRAQVATADNTKNIYTFLTKHLRNVGKNVERIVQHFKIKKGILGENTEEKGGAGILGKLKRFLTNPIGAMRDAMTWVFSGMTKALKGITDTVTKALTVPFKLLMKGVGLLNDFVGGIRKNFGEIFGAIKDTVLGVGGMLLKGARTLVVETAKAVGGALKGIAEAVPAMAAAVTSAATSILKAGGEILGTALKIAGDVSLAVLKMGGEMIRTAVSVTKDVVTSLARVTFDAIGGAVRAMRGGSSASLLGALTPVFVTGGYLAGTEGGVATLAEAQAASGGRKASRAARAAAGAAAGSFTGLGAILGAAVGFFSPELAQKMVDGKESLKGAWAKGKKNIREAFEGHMKSAREIVRGKVKAAGRTITDLFKRSGATDDAAADGAAPKKTLRERITGGFTEVKDRIKKSADAAREFKWRDRLISSSEGAQRHLKSIQGGFSKFSTWIMPILGAIGTGIMGVAEYFLKGKFLSSIAGLFGKEGLIAKAGGAVGNLVKGGAWKGVAAGAAAGIGGTLVKNWADDNMEDGAGKTAVKTGGAMLQYGGMGAAIGSVIPGVGTAIGAGVGAGVGAVVENWDAIVDKAKRLWNVVSGAASAIGDSMSWLGNAAKSVVKAGWSFYFGNDIELDENGIIVRQEQSNLLGRMWEGIFGTDAKQLKDGQIVKEGGIGLVGNVKNGLLNVVGVFGKMLAGDEITMRDFVKDTVLDGIWTKISDTLSSFGKMLVGIGEGVANGFRYVTELRFIDDIKGAIKSWWNGDDAQKKSQTGAKPDDLPWYKRWGRAAQNWSEENKARVNVKTVDLDGKTVLRDPKADRERARQEDAQRRQVEAQRIRQVEEQRKNDIVRAESDASRLMMQKQREAIDKRAADRAQIANRAFGGPLGKNGTLVGELGPELLDGRGNVISANKFQNPALVGKAQERGDGILEVLRSIRDNTYYGAAYGEASAMGGMAASPSEADKVRAGVKGVKGMKTGGTFRPGAVLDAGSVGFGKSVSAVEGADVKSAGSDSSGILGTVGQVGSQIGQTVGEMGDHVWSAVKGAGRSYIGGVKRGGEALLRGDFGGAFSAGWEGLRGAGSALREGASNVGASFVRGASNVGQIVMGKPTDEVLAAIKKASDQTGADFGYMLAMAGQESGFNPAAKARTSSASGLYQFLDATWRDVVGRYGARYGIKEGDRSDPYAQAVMGAMYAKENGQIVRNVVGRDANPTELYLGHFLGGGGVQSFMRGMQRDRTGTPATMREYSAAAKANSQIFLDGGRPRTFQEIYDLMSRKVGAKAIAYAQEYGQKAAALARKGGAKIKTAMAGGVLDGKLPTLVGERRPEVLGADGRIHSSVSAFVTSPGADVAGLARTTAVQEALRRASKGEDVSGANAAMEQVFKAVSGKGNDGKSEDLLSKILEVLERVAENTGRSLTADDIRAMATAQSAAAAPGPTRNLFTMNGGSERRATPGPSPLMSSLVSG